MDDDAQSDRAGITYTHNDYVELWFTKFQPFKECGIWANIPGIRLCILEIEQAEMQHQPNKTY